MPRLRLIACSILLASPLLAHAETLPLKMDRTFKQLPPSEEGAAFVSAKEMETQQGERIEARGEVELRQAGRVVNADHLIYEQGRQQVYADGNVRLEQSALEVTGPRLQLELEQNTGTMEQPEFVLGEHAARGHARQAEMQGNNHYLFHSATYTTCPAGNDDWLLKVSRLDIDRNTQVGVAHHARVEFMG
ncbi:MAG: LPS-assembly protein LptD, partial [Gallionella sp.]|nr:LPS-assembly protein LptD [Gallionella sp.]